MDISTKIRAVLGALKVSEAELARRIGTSPSALHQRMATGKFKTEELEKIAEALGCKFEFHFILPNGEKL